MELNNIDGFVFDLDGTIYLGEALLPGAAEVIDKLRHRQKRILFVTNKPLVPREVYADKLTRLGIPAKSEDIITSGLVLGHHLAKTDPQLKLYVIGEEALKDELRSYGLDVLDEFDEQDEKEVIDPGRIEAVVVAFDRTLNYRKINTAYQALMKGARFYATNADKICPMVGGGIPDAGGTIAMLEHMTGCKVELLAGKPSKIMLQVALDRMGLPAKRCVMIGDRLETDIMMGKSALMLTGVVLTGVTTRVEALDFMPKSDFVFETLEELLALI